MPKRKRKKYTKPRRPFDKTRIDEENVLIEKYGLKNKKEIWKADSAVDKMRKQAKLLLTRDVEEQNIFIENLKKQGFEAESITDILALNKEDYLKRRLQSVVVKKSLASTPGQARQFIVHKHIAIDNKIVNIPSYLVPLVQEDKISLRLVKNTKEKKPMELGVNPAESAEASSGEENARE